MTSRQISQVVPAELVQPLFNKINALAKSQQHAHWYMRRLEEYLSACSRRPVSDHTTDEITGWFSDLGRKSALTDWQFRHRWYPDAGCSGPGIQLGRLEILVVRRQISRHQPLNYRS